MKRTIYLLISLLLANYSIANSNSLISGGADLSTDSLRVVSTPDLYNLSVKWATEYSKLFPNAKIKVTSVSDINLAAALVAKGNIGFISNDFSSGFEYESVFKTVIGRDVIVPVINSKNPYAAEISEHGISPKTLVSFLKTKDSGTWGALLSNNEKSKVNLYKTNDESVLKGLAGFLKTELSGTEGVEVKSIEEMISAIQKDPYSMGFCKMIDILDFKNQRIAENLRLLPIDRNNDGSIDYNEKIYDDFNAFSRGVWIGKYPKALVSNIYSVTLNKKTNEAELAFMKWVLTDGQQYLYSNGYSDLLLTERLASYDKFYNTKVYSAPASNDKSVLITALVIIALLIATGVILDSIIRWQRRRTTAAKKEDSLPQKSLEENSLIIPAGIYFDKTHTWAFMEQNGVVKVGIDDFLQHITGNITRIKMKSPGEKVKKGEQIVSIIQNGKQLNLYSPVSGIIISQNNTLDSNSSLINSSPYTDGWFLKIEPTNWVREIQLLFMAEKQKEYIKNEIVRLKDFLSVALKGDLELYPQVVLQDGGEIKDSVLSNLGPEVWDDFQTKFIDPARQVWFYEIF